MMTERLGFIVLLLGQAAMASRDPEVVCSPGPVEAAVGEDVVLRCHLEPPRDATDVTVEWSHGHLNHCVHLYRDREDNPSAKKEPFEGRTALSREGLTRGNLSLELSSVRLDDTGRYGCSFTAAKLHKSCYVNLTVVPEGKGKRTEQIDDSTENKEKHKQQAGSGHKVPGPLRSHIIAGIVVAFVVVVVVVAIVAALACGTKCDAICACLLACLDVCQYLDL